MSAADIFLAVLAILFPPIAVWVKCGICSADSIINILLCCLGFLPGLFHAWYIIAKFPETPVQYESLAQEGGPVHYVYVQGPHGSNSQAPARQNGMNYGTQGRGGSSGPHVGSQAHGSNGVPPSYADVVAGDNKIQSHD